MEHIQLPIHIVEQVERRWEAKFGSPASTRSEYSSVKRPMRDAAKPRLASGPLSGPGRSLGRPPTRV